MTSLPSTQKQPPSVAAAVTVTLEQAKATATATMNNRISPKTIKAYQNKIKQMKNWIEKHCEGRTLSFPINHDDIMCFFGNLVNGQKLAPDTVSSYKSALLYHHNVNVQEWDKQLEIKLSSFMKGYKRQVSEMRQNGEMKLYEGKHPITMSGFKLIAGKLMQVREEESKSKDWSRNVFWCFFVLQWNLMARCSTIAAIMLQHLSWQEDALVVTTPKHKGDQEGAKVYPRHVYANPFEPFICPILSLAVLIFSRSYAHSEEPKDKNKLFQGEQQESRFSKILRRTLTNLQPTEAALLGAKPEDIGTHSCRKGAPTYCYSVNGGPSATNISLRAGWSLGNVQDRYIFSSSGGDQYTGRVASGLPNTSVDFAVLPPHFEAGYTLTVEQWAQIHPNYSSFPDSFKQVALYLLASIVYHQDWLGSNLHKEHPFRSSYLFTSGLMSQFKPHVTLVSKQITPTGIPPHLSIASQLSNITKAVQETRQDIIARCDTMPQTIETRLLNRFAIHGAIPVTKDDLRNMLKNVIEEFKHLQTTTQSQSQNTNEVVNNAENKDNERWWKHWYYDGFFHFVPLGFVFPTGNVRNIWNLWWFGNRAESIRPYRLIRGKDLPKQKSTLSKTNTLMKAIIAKAKSNKILAEEASVERLSTEQSAVLFEQTYNTILDEINRDTDNSRRKRRLGEDTQTTIYDHLKGFGGSRKKKRSE